MQLRGLFFICIFLHYILPYFVNKINNTIYVHKRSFYNITTVQFK